MSLEGPELAEQLRLAREAAARNALQDDVSVTSEDHQQSQAYVDAVNDVLNRPKSEDDESESSLGGSIFGKDSALAALHAILVRNLPQSVVDGAKNAAHYARALEGSVLGTNTNETFPASTVKIPQALNTRVRIAVAFFEREGWTHAEAVGITANLVQESNLNEHLFGDSGAAYGLQQAHEDRRKAIEAHFKKKMKDFNFLEGLAAVNYELTEGLEQRAGRAIRATTTAYEAAGVVSAKYERPLRHDAEIKHRGDIAVSLLAVANDSASALAALNPHGPPYTILPNAYQNIVAVGDSITHGLQLAGDTRIGRQPAEVLNVIQSHPGNYRGKDVILSTGLSNNPTALAYVAKEIEALHAAGARRIIVLGVGTRSDFAGINQHLAQTTSIMRNQGIDVRFTGALANMAQISRDSVHPSSYEGIKLAVLHMFGSWGTAPAPQMASAGPRRDDHHLHSGQPNIQARV